MRLSANDSAVGRSLGIRAICTEFWNSRTLGTELVSYGDIQISSDAACGPSATEPLNMARRRATSAPPAPQCWPRSEMALRRDEIWQREQGRPGITSTARELLGSRDRHFYSPPGESTGARCYFGSPAGDLNGRSSLPIPRRRSPESFALPKARQFPPPPCI